MYEYRLENETRLCENLEYETLDGSLVTDKMKFYKL